MIIKKTGFLKVLGRTDYVVTEKKEKLPRRKDELQQFRILTVLDFTK